MAGKIGRTISFKWDGVEVAGVREKSVAINGEPVDVTSDEDNGWRTLLTDAGENSVNISLSGITKSDALKAAWFSGDRTEEVTLTYPDGGIVSGAFFLATFNETGPYNDAVTFDCELQSSGEVEYAAAAAPANVVLPAVSGTAQVGETLTALPGIWTGAVSFTYQWKADGSNIEGATGSTYNPVIGDVGNPITVVVTAVNSTGSTPAESADTIDVLSAG